MNIAKVARIFVVSLAMYQVVAWMAFQWRNPLANSMSFYRDFVEVATWQKLPEYQPDDG